MGIVQEAENIFGGVAQDAPFSVNGQAISLADLEDVKSDERPLIPPTPNVLLRIADARMVSMSEGKLKKINILWECVEGVEVGGEMKYVGGKFWQNGKFFDNVFTYACPTRYTSKYFTDKKHLAQLKSLIQATGGDPIDPDDLAGTLIGKEIRGNIVQVENESKDEETGEYVGDGTYTNCVKYFKSV